MHAASAEAVEAWDRLLDDYAAFRPTLPDRLRTLIEADPEMSLAHGVRAALLMLSGKGSLRAAAVESATLAERLSRGTSLRERLHARAVLHWTRGEDAAAVRLWEEILAHAPTDLLALKLAQFAHFYAGDSRAMRRSSDRTVAAWDAEVPRYSYWLGARAFALEESGALADAEHAGRSAVAIEADDAWAIHAVAHCLETTGRPAEGIAWIDGLADHWRDAGTMDGHLQWHRALFVLETDTPAEVLAHFDAGMHPADSDEYLDLCNDIALLQRLELLGVDVGDRWARLAAAADLHRHDRMLPFCDVHWVLALAAGGRLDAADALIDDLAERARADSPEALSIREAALPLARGLRAWRKGDAGQAVDRLRACHDRIHRIGGSHAQRDLFEQIYAAAARAAGDRALVAHLLRERRLQRPDDRLAAALDPA
ncbi:MAG TPA: tetratricopeptide repeat protein [Pseudomonadales bacterium]|nr:tetratricopeptide repeat protein [Pseudomonadales bacterium]